MYAKTTYLLTALVSITELAAAILSYLYSKNKI